MPTKPIIALSNLIFRIGFEDEAVGQDPSNEIRYRDHFVSMALIEVLLYLL
jgi:hypothetical protein